MATLLAAPMAANAHTTAAQSASTVAKAEAQQTVLVSEDFSKMTAGSESNPDFSFYINNCGSSEPTGDEFYSGVNTEYTQQPGWGSYMVYPAGGMLCFNNTRVNEYYAAHFNTPEFDATANNGTFFVSFRARLVNPDPNYAGLGIRALDFTDPEGASYIFFDNVKGMSTEWQTFTLRYEGGTAKTRLMFCEEYGDQVLIDDIKVSLESTGVDAPNVLRHLYYNGTSFRARWNKVEGADKYLVNVYKSDAEGKLGDQVVTDLESTDTICTVRGIVPGVIYRYNVKAVQGDVESLPSRNVVLNELQAPNLEDVNEINDGKYTARWEKVPNALYYNYYVYADRVADKDGEFTLIDEDFNTVCDADGKTGYKYSDDATDDTRVDWEAGAEPDALRTQTYGYPLGLNNRGYFATNWVPLKAGYLMTDGWHYYYDAKENLKDPESDDDVKEYGKFETPILNFAEDGTITVKASLWGEYAMDTQDMSQYPNFPSYQVNANIALVRYDAATGLYEEVESNHVNLKQGWTDAECTFTKGYEDAKIVIYAVDGPGILYIDNLKVTQQMKKGDKFASCIVCEPGLTDTYVNVELPEGYEQASLYHRTTAVNEHESKVLSKTYFYYSGPSELVQIQEGSSTAINDTVAKGGAVEVARYSLDGTRIAAPQKGVNIVKMSNGTVRKVVVE